MDRKSDRRSLIGGLLLVLLLLGSVSMLVFLRRNAGEDEGSPVGEKATVSQSAGFRTDSEARTPARDEGTGRLNRAGILSALRGGAEMQDSQRFRVELAQMDYFQDLKSILGDITLEEDVREAAARILLQSGQKEGIQAVLTALIDEAKERPEFRDRLLQLLADLRSEAAAEVLIDFWARHASRQEVLPLDLRRLSIKLLRSFPAEIQVGVRMAEHYLSSDDPEARHALIRLEFPEMLAALAVDANRQGEEQQVRGYVDHLMQLGSADTLNGLQILARKAVVPLPEISLMAYDWSRLNDVGRIEDRLRSTLSSPQTPDEERIVAAYALAAMGEKAIPFLEKALQYEANDLVHEHLSKSLSLSRTGYQQ